MASYRYRLVNVFADSPLTGNPLCVFEDARGLDDATMQALALQFNLSETTFVLPSTQASARVRIFTPTFEMPLPAIRRSAARKSCVTSCRAGIRSPSR
jgi:PhzF family phenazine biosynthesis protein